MLSLPNRDILSKQIDEKREVYIKEQKIEEQKQLEDFIGGICLELEEEMIRNPKLKYYTFSIPKEIANPTFYANVEQYFKGKGYPCYYNFLESKGVIVLNDLNKIDKVRLFFFQYENSVAGWMASTFLFLVSLYICNLNIPIESSILGIETLIVAILTIIEIFNKLCGVISIFFTLVMVKRIVAFLRQDKLNKRIK